MPRRRSANLAPSVWASRALMLSYALRDVYRQVREARACGEDPVTVMKVVLQLRGMLDAEDRFIEPPWLEAAVQAMGGET